MKTIGGTLVNALDKPNSHSALCMKVKSECILKEEVKEWG